VSGRFGDFVARADAAALVVTAFDGEEPSGCLVGFASQCSIEPPRFVVWLSTVNHTFGVASRAGLLAVHLVPSSATDLAALFAEESGDWSDKFARCSWSEGPDGVPLLDACPDRVVGRVVDRCDIGGDHVGFVLDPVEVSLGAAAGRRLHLADVASLTPGHPVD
jgi:flavin reductase (DIM6/NTAB) family NADH-FMN oxidoreductase RutF